MADKKGGAPRKEEVVTREYTVNLHKRLHGWYATSRPTLFAILAVTTATLYVPAARSDAIDLVLCPAVLMPWQFVSVLIYGDRSIGLANVSLHK
jgi:large subunit ribosomal protein L31e